MARTKGYPEALEKKLRDTRLYADESHPQFTKTVEKVSMTIPHMCYQCGTCTASCPSAPRSSYRIRKNSPVVILRSETVGPSVGQEVATRAAGAVGLAALGIMLYITFAFRGVPHAFRYGVAAIIAMLHDVLVVLGVEAILGHFLGWEVDALFLTALLTVISFSVHDTIVVFDRIRENTTIYRRLPYETVVNHSIVQTLVRSINTQLTVMFTLLALVLFGGVTLRHFVIILMVGVFSGTYSSIFNAAPILVVWENREWRYWFKRHKNEEAIA